MADTGKTLKARTRAKPPQMSDDAYAIGVADPEVSGPSGGKAARTREKLLNATIECLYRYGYYRTSTILVTKVAGVSRGSLLHQFPTRADLMVATAEHIAHSRAKAHLLGMAGAESSKERFSRLVPILWEELKQPSGIARLEIMMASRSDPELSKKFKPLNILLAKNHSKAVWALLKDMGMADRNKSDAMVELYAAALRGLSIDALFLDEHPSIESAAELLGEFAEHFREQNVGVASDA